MKRQSNAERKAFHVKLFKTPKETVQALATAAVYKAAFRLDALIVLSCLSGFWIGLGSLVSLIAAGGLPNADPGVRKLVAGTTFSIGLMLVVTGTELFTSNIMFMTVGVLERRVSWLSLLRNWIVTWVFNFLSSALFAYLLAYLPGFLVQDPYASYLQAVTMSKTSTANWGITLLKGIGCNLLVCMAILVAVASEDYTSKFLSVFFFISTFIIIGYEHCVANMTILSLGAFYGYTDFGTVLAWNIIPVTLGNIIGGAFVACSFWYTYLFTHYATLQAKRKGILWDLLHGVPAANKKRDLGLQQNWERNQVPLQ